MINTYLAEQLESRKKTGIVRRLKTSDHLIDFSSNDYLGLSKSQEMRERIINAWQKEASPYLGSTGSRLLSGHRQLMEDMEIMIASYHEAENGLLFNSGYSANMGLISCIASKEDLFLFDAHIHASMHEGMRQSLAKALSFRHNDMDHLEGRLKAYRQAKSIFVLIESVYSCDGSIANLEAIARICRTYGANLIVDEAHATGTIGKRGEGLVATCGLQENVFARIHTFSKALGGYGAIVLGSLLLKEYLINFCRPLIYATALPTPVLINIREAYACLPKMQKEREYLERLIKWFKEQANLAELPLIPSETPIQAILIPDHVTLRKIAAHLESNGFDARPLFSPTVKPGKERLRLTLHVFNTFQEVSQVVNLIQQGMVIDA